MNTIYSLGGAFGTYGREEQGGRVGSAQHERGNRQKGFLVSGSETGEVLWWDVQSKEVLQKEAAHNSVVLDVDTWDGEEGGLVVSCGVDRTVRVWAMQEAGEDDGEEEGEGEGGGGREREGNGDEMGGEDRE